MLTPPTDLTSPPFQSDAALTTIHSCVQCIAAVAASDVYPWDVTQGEIVRHLLCLPSASARVAVFEVLGNEELETLQYADDVNTPCPGFGAACAVMSPPVAAACERYAKKI